MNHHTLYLHLAQHLRLLLCPATRPQVHNLALLTLGLAESADCHLASGDTLLFAPGKAQAARRELIGYTLSPCTMGCRASRSLARCRLRFESNTVEARVISLPFMVQFNGNDVWGGPPTKLALRW